MEEIKVGEYIRTKDGCIFKATEYWLGECYSDRVNIKKHSPNIINLIEEGDYVNGEQVVGKDNNCILLLTDKGQTFLRNIFESKYIKSIVTHQQFKSIEYTIHEREEKGDDK